jgi:hypothetical protein
MPRKIVERRAPSLWARHCDVDQTSECHGIARMHLTRFPDPGLRVPRGDPVRCVRSRGRVQAGGRSGASSPRNVKAPMITMGLSMMTSLTTLNPGWDRCGVVR